MSEAVISQETLGGYLAAVANHEAKAVVLSSMELGVPYSKGMLFDRLQEVQGHEPGYPVSRGVPLRYCSISFEPIGAVAKAREGEYLRFEVTDEGETVGKALAGHTNDLSLDFPEVALHGLWGMTKTNSKSGDRPPIRRLKMMRSILASLQAGVPITINSISEGLDDLHPDIVRHQLKGMAEGGVINLSTASAQDEAQRTYIFADTPQEVDASEFRMPNLAQCVIEATSSLALAGKDSFSLDDVENAVRGTDMYGNRSSSLRLNIAELLRALAEQGLWQKQGFERLQKSEIEVSPRQRLVIERVVSMVDLLLEGDQEFVNNGRKIAARIIGDPATVRRLIAKGYANSPEVKGVPVEIRAGTITNFIRSKGTASTTEILEILSSIGVTKSSGKSTLQAMRKEGLLESVRVGFENAWALSETAE